MPESAFDSRILPLTGLLISSAALLHTIRISVMLGDFGTMLWFWVPQRALLNLSLAGLTLLLVTCAAVGVAVVVAIELWRTPSVAFGLFAAATVAFGILFISYAAGSYRFRDLIATRALEHLERHGYTQRLADDYPFATAEALKKLGFSPPPPPIDD